MNQIAKVPSTHTLQQAANLPIKEINKYIDSLKLVSFDLIQTDQLMHNIIAMKPSDFKNQMVDIAQFLQSLIQERMCMLQTFEYIRIKQQLKNKKQKSSMFACFKEYLLSLSSILCFVNSYRHVEPQGALSACNDQQMQQLNIQKLTGSQLSNLCSRYEQCIRKYEQFKSQYEQITFWREKYSNRGQEKSKHLNRQKKFNRQCEQCNRECEHRHLYSGYKYDESSYMIN